MKRRNKKVLANEKSRNYEPSFFYTDGSPLCRTLPRPRNRDIVFRQHWRVVLLLRGAHCAWGLYGFLVKLHGRGAACEIVLNGRDPSCRHFGKCNNIHTPSEHDDFG